MSWRADHGKAILHTIPDMSGKTGREDWFYVSEKIIQTEWLADSETLEDVDLCGTQGIDRNRIKG